MLSPIPCPPLVSPLKCPGGDRLGVPRPQPGGQELCLCLWKGSSSVLLSPPSHLGRPFLLASPLCKMLLCPSTQCSGVSKARARCPGHQELLGESTDPRNASCLDHPLHQANGPHTIFLQGS